MSHAPELLSQLISADEVLQLQYASQLLQESVPAHILLSHEGLATFSELLLRAQQGVILQAQSPNETNQTLRDRLKLARQQLGTSDWMSELFSSHPTTGQSLAPLTLHDYQEEMSDVQADISQITFAYWMVVTSLGILQQHRQVSYHSLHQQYGGTAIFPENRADQTPSYWVTNSSPKHYFSLIDELLTAAARVRTAQPLFEKNNSYETKPLSHAFLRLAHVVNTTRQLFTGSVRL